MALFTVENLSFSYDEHTVLQDVCFKIDEGQFVALCGSTGSGKSTLLRLLKKEIQPVGHVQGQILFDGQPLKEASSNAISFVMQKPDEQLVMEKVWQELAFPLENQAIPPHQMEQRIAEVMNFLGIHHLFQARTASLSGGQKQLVNLAAALVTQPRVILLDEPTAQLDPLAATQFMQLLGRIHRELSITICIVEHRLDDLVDIIDEVLLLENKTIIEQLPPRQLVRKLTQHPLLRVFGAAAYIFSKAQLTTTPLTIHEAKNNLPNLAYQEFTNDLLHEQPTILEAHCLYFRYEKKDTDLLKDVCLTVRSKDILTIVGGNGTGKSTLLQVLAGLLKPYKGKVLQYTDAKQVFALLPQNPQSVFMKNTVLEELDSLEKLAPSHFAARKQKIIELFDLEYLLDVHPFDLSGGQQQLVAFAKIYCLNCPIVLLDEPTKGLDVQAKQLILQAIRLLQQEGKTTIIVTHDLDFAAECSTHCTMLFQGKLTAIQPVREFFCTNHFYTTAARRITAHLSNAITCDEVITQLTKQGDYIHA